MADTEPNDEMMAILTRLEQNQAKIEAGQRALSEQLEKLEEAVPEARQFRSHARQFGGYGARNIADKLRARNGEVSAASRRKANGHGRTEAAVLPA